MTTTKPQHARLPQHCLRVAVTCSCGGWASVWDGIDGIAQGFADHLLFHEKTLTPEGLESP